MSKHETPMLLEYWKQTGGVLIEEFHAVKRTSTNSQRYIDGIIILGEETRIDKRKRNHCCSSEGKPSGNVFDGANVVFPTLNGEIQSVKNYFCCFMQ